MSRVQRWTKDLGYDQVPGALLNRADRVPADHPFATEVGAMFVGGDIGADVVLCVDRVPTVCLVDAKRLTGPKKAQSEQIRAFCERLWNQNLARIVLIAGEDSLEAWSVDDPKAVGEKISADAAATLSEFSFRGLLSGEVLKNRPSWFDPHKRVDKTLLDNVGVLVDRLSTSLSPARARELTASVIFVAYLEDREIITEEYRGSRGVSSLIDLLQSGDAAGLERLYRQLQKDFNGDFLAPDERGGRWSGLSDQVFEDLHQFLQRTVLRSGQTDLWRYNFAQIPIELIAGIYETFLGQKDHGSGAPGASAKKRQGAYYTPRLLSDWVVEQALDGRDILKERIFDGACGSGMLLTAAFRRLMRAQRADAERRKLREEAFGFAARSELLLGHIFGSDIDEDARRLTAFSLYLALLSELTPRDLETLRKGGHKLPSLKKNIRGGTEQGNFFNSKNEKANRGQYTIFLCNPPWRELPSGEADTDVVKAWASRQSTPVFWPKQQIAAAFAIGAADTLSEDGRVALILPIGLFVSAEKSARNFRANLLARYSIDCITNFADMRRLIFVDADHPFVVMIATRRARPFDELASERFEYWTPKTDIALSFGRLTLHGADRIMMSSQDLISETPHLRLRYWGTLQDVDLLQRLWQHGTIDDLRSECGWTKGKGFHLVDNDRRVPAHLRSVAPSAWLRRHKFLNARRIPTELPIVDAGCLEKFTYEAIAREPAELRRGFEGPRVIWPDGTHPENGVKAVFADAPFSYQHSVAFLSAPDTEEGRREARFLTAYMRSSMGTWLSLLLSHSVAAERPKLHLNEALTWPYWPIARHPNPRKAKAIIAKTDRLLAEIEEADPLLRGRLYEDRKSAFDQLVFDYFALGEGERVLVEELATYAGPSLQPGSLSYDALVRSMRRPPTTRQVEGYCHRLVAVLSAWRDATGGKGELHASAWTARSVPIGGVVVTIGNSKSAKGVADRIEDDGVVGELLATVASVADASPERMLTVPDIIAVQGKRITIVKPLVTRFWLERSAIEDASKLASEISAIKRLKRSA